MKIEKADIARGTTSYDFRLFKGEKLGATQAIILVTSHNMGTLDPSWARGYRASRSRQTHTMPKGAERYSSTLQQRQLSCTFNQPRDRHLETPDSWITDSPSDKNKFK